MIFNHFLILSSFLCPVQNIGQTDLPTFLFTTKQPVQKKLPYMLWGQCDWALQRAESFNPDFSIINLPAKYQVEGAGLLENQFTQLLVH